MVASVDPREHSYGDKEGTRQEALAEAALRQTQPQLEQHRSQRRGPKAEQHERSSAEDASSPSSTSVDGGVAAHGVGGQQRTPSFSPPGRRASWTAHRQHRIAAPTRTESVVEQELGAGGSGGPVRWVELVVGVGCRLSGQRARGRASWRRAVPIQLLSSWGQRVFRRTGRRRAPRVVDVLGLGCEVDTRRLPYRRGLPFGTRAVSRHCRGLRCKLMEPFLCLFVILNWLLSRTWQGRGVSCACSESVSPPPQKQTQTQRNVGAEEARE